jgi:hypothetical protein
MQPQPATFSHLGPAVRLISIPAQAFSCSGDQLPVHGQTLPIPATPFTTACLHVDASGNPQIVEMMNSQKAQEKALTGSSLARVLISPRRCWRHSKADFLWTDYEICCIYNALFTGTYPPQRSNISDPLHSIPIFFTYPCEWYL